MITIVDYQMGNLRSVQKAIQKVGGEATISDDPHVIANARQLILPGVGGFGEAIDEIRRRDLERPLMDYLQSGKPFLGICLGLQMLFDEGYENGVHRGLGFFPGSVKRFDESQFEASARTLKVPHMGWNTVKRHRECALLSGTSEETHFYFVHSFHVCPAEEDLTVLSCHYGYDFTAMVSRGNVMATQFHPEKSQEAGLKILQNFVEMSGATAAV
ncbi:MAG: imidazole glycerol phosphate synthase subunit HisH [Planctomycetota bacterium]